MFEVTLVSKVMKGMRKQERSKKETESRVKGRLGEERFIERKRRIKLWRMKRKEEML